MSAGTDIIVLELTTAGAAEPEAMLLRFAEVAAEIDVTTVQRWTPSETAYVVVHDPESLVFEAVESASGLRISRAARLEFPNHISVDPESLPGLLPSRLEQPILFPLPAKTEPKLSIPPPAPPLVFCPNCAIRIHPPPVCSASQS